MLEQLGLPINGDSLVIDFAAAGAIITYKGTPIPLQTDSVVKQGFRGLTRLIETAIQQDYALQAHRKAQIKLAD